MKFSILILIIVLVSPTRISGQGLFESSNTAEEDISFPFQLSGYTRGVAYLGEYSTPHSSEIKSAYGEASLRINASSGDRGRLYTDLRFRSGYEYNEWINEFQLREAYADVYLGNFELRAGHAIIAWGRTDAVNPTDNLTPRDYFVRSPESDDMRLGNFLIRSRYSIIPQLRLEAVWVPMYKYSTYRFDLFEMPDYIAFSESSLPAAAIKNGSIAVKMDFLFNGFDGSLSWFNGFDPMPGIQPGEIPGSPSEEMIIEMYARAFRQQTLGLDFSFGLGSFGVRGEAAFRNPVPDYRDRVFAPRPDLCYVLETDRTFGDFHLMLMYMGRYVFDFTEIPVQGGMPEIDPTQLQNPAILAMLGPMMDQEVAGFNRIIFDQTNEISHTIGLRPSLAMFHGVSRIEVFAMYNISTEEWGLFPRLTWDVTDNLKLSAGGQYFQGGVNTRHDLIAPVFNSGYLELKYSF